MYNTIYKAGDRVPDSKSRNYAMMKLEGGIGEMENERAALSARKTVKRREISESFANEFDNKECRVLTV